MLIRTLFIALVLSAQAAANPTNCTISVFSPVVTCQSHLGCPFILGTALGGVGAFTGQVTYSWGARSCVASEQNTLSGRSFTCDFTIDTIGPHQITANFVGSNGFANTSCTTVFETGKRWSTFQVLATPQQPYVIGMPSYTIGATVQSASAGQLQLWDGAQLVASAAMSSNGTAAMVTTPAFLAMFVQSGTPRLRLINDPNAQIGQSNNEIVTLSTSPISNGIVWAPQHLQGMLVYDPALQQINANLDLQLPATAFAAPVTRFSLTIDGAILFASNAVTSGQRQTLSIPMAGVWLGRKTAALAYDPVATTVLDNAPQIEINTGGFE
jgi:hypothetical protein